MRKPGAMRGPRSVIREVTEVSVASGGVRMLTVLEPAPATAYATVVRAAGVRVAGHGIALGPGGLPHARRVWHRAVASSRGPGVAAIRSDVRDCYASITLSAVEAGLRAADADRAALARIVEMLRSMQRSGVRGLPIGPTPSAILADAVLSIGDRAAVQAGGRIVRWVDDVVITADDRPTALRAFDAWRRALGPLGLVPHEGKTSVDATIVSGAAPGSALSPAAHGMMRPP